jgi:hypothetical protein
MTKFYLSSFVLFDLCDLCLREFWNAGILVLQVPVRVAGGLLFELTGHSIGDPNHDEEDIAVILRSWQSQNFLITSMHVKGIINHLNVLGVMEVQVPLFGFFQYTSGITK